MECIQICRKYAEKRACLRFRSVVFWLRELGIRGGQPHATININLESETEYKLVKVIIKKSNLLDRNSQQTQPRRPDQRAAPRGHASPLKPYQAPASPQDLDKSRHRISNKAVQPEWAAAASLAARIGAALAEHPRNKVIATARLVLGGIYKISTLRRRRSGPRGVTRSAKTREF